MRYTFMTYLAKWNFFAIALWAASIDGASKILLEDHDYVITVKGWPIVKCAH